MARYSRSESSEFFVASGSSEQLHERDTLAECNFQPSIKSVWDRG